MKVRNIAEFRADFPDDSIEDERGFVRYPGLGVAEAIAQMCRDMGLQVPAPESEAELGWVFDVQVGKRRYWFRLSDLGDRIILVSRDMTRYAPTPGDIGHDELLRRLDAAMKAGGRFSDIGWYTDVEYQMRGEEFATSAGATPSLSQRLRWVARAGVFICIVLFGVAFPLVELLNALGSFAEGRAAIGGLHALAGIGGVVFLFRGPTWITKWLNSRRS